MCPALASSPTQTTCADAFVTKLDPSGRLVYSTYLGGSGSDGGGGIAVDSSGNAYLAGATQSADFPLRPIRTRQALAKDTPS